MFLNIIFLKNSKKMQNFVDKYKKMGIIRKVGSSEGEKALKTEWNKKRSKNL